MHNPPFSPMRSRTQALVPVMPNPTRPVKVDLEIDKAIERVRQLQAELSILEEAVNRLAGAVIRLENVRPLWRRLLEYLKRQD